MPTVTMMMILGTRSRDVPLGAPVLPRRLRPREGSRWGPSSGPSAKPFLSGCDLDFSLLSMDSDGGVQAEAAWSVPWAEGAGCKHCLGDTSSSCRAVAAALISWVSIMLLQSVLRSISLHTNQGLQNLAVTSYGSGSGPMG